MNHQDPSRESMKEQQEIGQETTYLQHRPDVQPSQRQDKRLSSSTAQTRNMCSGPSLKELLGPWVESVGGTPGEAGQGN